MAFGKKSKVLRRGGYQSSLSLLAFRDAEKGKIQEKINIKKKGERERGKGMSGSEYGGRGVKRHISN